MLKEYKTKKENWGFAYPDALELMMSWGKAHLFFPQDIGKQETLQAELSDGILDIPTELDKGISLLEEDVQDALECLNGSPFFFPEESDDALTSLEILDYTVFLQEAAEHYPRPDIFPEGFVAKAEALFRQSTLDRSPSPLSLIPLNHWRRAILEHIPQEHRYLFPWYADWSEAPEEIISDLIDNWDAIVSGEAEISGLEPAIADHLLNELSLASALIGYIREQVQTEKAIFKAIEQSLGLRLYHLCDQEAVHYPIPEIVEAKGLVNCACKVIQDMKINSNVDVLEGLLQGAFCGPMLDAKQRVDLFDEVEQELSRLDPRQLPANSALEGLVRWQEGEISDTAFAKQLFESWGFKLETVARTAFRTETKTVNDFRHSLQNLRYRQKEKEREKDWISDNIIRIFGYIKSPYHIRRPKERVLYRSESSEDSGKEVIISADKNTFEIPIKTRRGKCLLFADTKEPNVSGVLRDLKEVRDDIYWNGFYVIQGESAKPIHDSTQKWDRRIYQMDKADYESIIVFIAPEKEIVEKVMDQRDLKDEEKEQLFAVIYTPQEE